jgi:hypothetical protein
MLLNPLWFAVNAPANAGGGGGGLSNITTEAGLPLLTEAGTNLTTET